MAFHQLSFSKLVRLNFIGACILFIYWLFNDLNNMRMQLNNVSSVELPPFPNNPKIDKIDVGRGEDFWILTDKNEVTYNFPFWPFF